jgi:hypothetical protein
MIRVARSDAVDESVDPAYVMARDLIWDAIASACKRMGERVDVQRLALGASTRRSWLRWEALQGFEVIENWTDVLLFEPVRRRPLLSRKW